MEISRHWRLRKQRYGLVGEVCPHCDAKIFPPRDVCPECGGEAKNLFNFSGRGEVYSYTTIYEPPQAMRTRLLTRSLWSNWKKVQWSLPS